MAKNGLLYYNVDTDRYDDIRIRKLKRGCGLQGLAVYDYLLCQIYRDKGYYMDYNDDVVFFLSEFLGVKECIIEEIVSVCCAVGLFDKDVRTSAGVLTSRSIQERYIKACKSLKRNGSLIIEPRLSLIYTDTKIPEEMANPPEKMANPPEKTPIPPEKIAQRDINKIKEGKEKSVLENPPAPEPVFSGSSGVDVSQADSLQSESAGKPKRGFRKPALEEVEAYCLERNNGIDAARFYDYHEAKGWVIGKTQTPMKDWRAAVRTWERNDYEADRKQRAGQQAATDTKTATVTPPAAKPYQRIQELGKTRFDLG